MVITEILKERFGLAPEYFGRLTIFALVNILIPGFVLRLAPPSSKPLKLPAAPKSPR